MTLRKLPDMEDQQWTDCRNPEHQPPGMIVLENGWYEHTCPACLKKTTFLVNRPTF